MRVVMQGRGDASFLFHILMEERLMIPSALQTIKWGNLPSTGNNSFWDDG